MELTIFQIDAFSDKVFGGNPAGVIPLESWLSDDIMQKIANENNLSETAFFVKENEHYHVRWFTPVIEVDLCGHATLGSAYVIFNELNHEGNKIRFKSRSGELIVEKSGDLLTLDFPADEIHPVELSEELAACFEDKPIEVIKGKTDYLFVFEDEKVIRNIKPNLSQISTLDARGVIVTAQGSDTDFVSRFFGPQSGVNEDPVTGSAHTTLTPFWAEKLNKTEFTAKQLSQRQGSLQCTLDGNRVKIAGVATKYLEGKIFF